MATQRSRASRRRVVTLDGNRLGLVGGAIVGTAVMALSFFVQESNWTTTAVRPGWSFVTAYALTFLLVNVIVHTRMTEAERLEALDAAEAEATVEAESMVEAAGEEAAGTSEYGAAGDPPISQNGG